MSTAMALIALAATGQARAGLVVNGGFETGDFTGWTLANSTNDTVTNDPNYAHSGTYGVHYGRVGSESFLFQTIATTAGDSYTFSFFQKTLNGTPNEFQAFWGGASILDVVNSPSATTWTAYSFTEVATGSSTEIRFGLRQDPGYSALDDVSVVDNGPTAVPEPSSLVLTGTAALAGFGFWMRKRRRTVAS